MHRTRAIVTGATAGIGRAIAVALAARGASLVLGCRDAERGRRAAGDISRESGSTDVTVMIVDTSSQRSIGEFARAYRERYDRLDVLVNNAGVAQGTREVTAEGIELTFATNVLGYFRLTRELFGVLTASAPSRIVNVASAFAGHLELDDLQFERRRYDVLEAYAQSKACDRMLTWAVTRRLQGTGVTANAYAPGFVGSTELFRSLPPDLKAVYRQRRGRTAEQGADTAVWMATDPALAGVTGRFFMDRRELPCEFRNEAAEERLWRICEDLSRAA